MSDYDSESSLEGDFNAEGGFFEDLSTLKKARSEVAIDPLSKSIQKKSKKFKRLDAFSNKATPLEQPKATQPQPIGRPKNLFKTTKTFSQLGLIKPLLKSVAELEFAVPTQIQEQSIPAALNGRDILGSSATGSGKTAAFGLPILQRFYGSFTQETRALIIIPTRELAVQCHEMMGKLNKYTKLSTCLIMGALPIEKQEAELRRRPCIVIATPGRLLDLVKNSKNIDLDSIEILVFDEADRLLELGFELEMRELLKNINPDRQTLLFSATLSSSLQAFGSLALKKPLRIAVGKEMQMAEGIKQEVVLVKEESTREAILVYILKKKVFDEKTIVFFKTKAQCHRMFLVLGLLGFSCAELHGDITQAARSKSFADFKGEGCQVLLATDVASRGIDVPDVRFVINFEIPMEGVRYIHRVGRTARAGEDGSSFTISSYPEFKVLRKMLKGTKIAFSKSAPPSKLLASYTKSIGKLEEEIKRLENEEWAEREFKKAEMEAEKASNMLRYKEEILNKPKREWVADFKGKRQVQQSDRHRFPHLVKAQGDSIEKNGRPNKRVKLH